MAVNKQQLETQWNELSEQNSKILHELGPIKALKDRQWRLNNRAIDAIKIALDVYEYDGDVTPRSIRPHKGGRDIMKTVRIASETEYALAYLRRFHNVTLGDLVAEATAEKFESVIAEESS